MTARRRPALASLVAVLAMLALSACGASHKPLTHEDNTGAGGVNSDYITLDNLKYQVQVSRQLNPYSTEDGDYLSGIPAGGLYPPAGQLWFGVFLLVLNPTKHPEPAVSSFSLSDTQNDVYKPVALPAGNPYAYRPLTLAGGQQIPQVDSTAYYDDTQASLLLFKINQSAYANRPLTLTLVDPENPAKTGTVTLDF